MDYKIYLKRQAICGMNRILLYLNTMRTTIHKHGSISLIILQNTILIKKWTLWKKLAAIIISSVNMNRIIRRVKKSVLKKKTQQKVVYFESYIKMAMFPFLKNNPLLFYESEKAEFLKIFICMLRVFLIFLYWSENVCNFRSTHILS